ncbi:MAG: tetrahydromethanopterin S-methyltransferase subunit H [Nitrososphaerales archaeon]
MFEFKIPQKVVKIGNVQIGGVPGERPTVLIGSIFYQGHKIVKDEMKGEFDKEKAEELIFKHLEFSDKTSNPSIIDVVGSTEEAMVKYLDFVTSKYEGVIQVDSTMPNVRLKGIAYLKEKGIKNPVIYNSLIGSEVKDDELKKIKDLGVKNSILLLYNSLDFTIKGRIAIVKELVDKATKAGIENFIVDACVIDIPSLGMACKAIYDIKNDFGFPCGCGAHNAVDQWVGLMTKMGRQAKEATASTAAGIAVASGADFILYGPIEHAPYVFPAIAMVDAAFSQIAVERGKRPLRPHPRYKIA